MRLGIRKIKKHVKHQGIGGKEIDIEFDLPISEVFKEASNGNWACYNFLDRRLDINKNYDQRTYYGKVNGLGYVVSEDELE